MKISVFGSGYVGLVSGACLAEVGLDVTCVDIDEKRVASLSDGQIPIYEPGLSELVVTNLQKGRLRFTTDAARAVLDREVVMIAVGTPQSENGAADLSAVLSVARFIAENVTRNTVVVDKSTVPPGTGGRIQALIDSALAERASREPSLAGLRVEVVSNPEFLKEGNAVEDFMKPDRIVVGCTTDWAFGVMDRMYQAFSRLGYKIVRMGVTSAELTKYAANAMLATRISFMNELSQLSEKCGADIDDVRRGIGSDPRIGKSFLFAGLGFGGSCFPKDLNALKACFQEAGLQPKMIDSVLQINTEQRRRFITRIVEHFDNQVAGKTFGIWGLSFKPRTDDVRESPAHTIIEELVKRGAKVKAYCPKGIENTRKALGYLQGSGQISYEKGMYECAEGALALILCTEWNEFRLPDFARVKDAMTGKTVFDGRNQYRRSELAEHGLELVKVG